ncbi:tyrosine-type recombinase/integrase [Halodesulfovibrio aestuarii]|uniref:Site-specific recombinase XerD n=1 Tax=Halodesulfovibrio aestuarii TaxID=126333 RepID=A0A8G2C984_9BACT|nr:site-specific integrase [Halodesulfovibrio aestuarii]SHJ05406.1 Site-specific recombinase XerD [Halodesulfovibrio aestuarii]
MSNTLKHAWDLYAELKLPSIRNAKNDKRNWQMHIEPYMAHMQLFEIKNIHIMQLRVLIEAKKLSPQTVKHVLGLLRRVLKKAIQWDLYDGPLPFFEMPQVQNERTRFLSKKEANLLLYDLQQRSPLWHDISVFALSTGLRAGEIFSLKPEHINLATEHVHVVGGKSKDRNVALNPTALIIAKKYSSKVNCKDKYLFTTIFGNKIPMAGKPFKSAVKACGLNEGVTDRRNKVVFHSLRHTFASWLVLEGYPIAVVSHLLGHSDIKMTMRYAHLSPEQGRKAVTSLNNYIVNVNRSTVFF